MSNILVTGGAGFIGSHVVDALLDAGHDVTVIDNLATGHRENVNPSATFIELDIRDDALGDAIEKAAPEYVFHLAAQINVTRSVREPVYDAQCNVIGSVNLLKRCVDQKVKKVIYASTGGAIYGDPTVLPVPETYPPKPVSPYGVSKYCVEHYLHLYKHLYDLDFTILRYPNVYGPRQDPHGEAGVCAILAIMMLDDETPTLYGFGEPTRDYVYGGDIARANLLAMDKGSGEILNLGSAKATSVNELFDIVSELTQFDREPVREALRSGEVSHIYCTGDRAAEVLGWRPEVDIREGLEHTVAFFRKKKKA